MIKVLLGGDEAAVADDVRHVLETAEDIVLAGTASDVTAILALARNVSANVLILDRLASGAASIASIGQLRSRAPNLRVLLVSTHLEQAYAEDAFRAGRVASSCKYGGRARFISELNRDLHKY